jgi:tetratricopeptide (TPR) repeat protein
VHDPQALQSAIAHLERAKRATYARRLLGKAYVARGQALSAVLALEQFIEQRPEQYLAQLELAAAYVYADEQLQELEHLHLLDHLAGARISAPDVSGQARYAPVDWQSEYVYPTTFSLPPEYGERPTLFVHAGSQVTWTVVLTQPSVLRFGMGQAPSSLGWGGDGATFEVFVDGERVFLEHLEPDRAQGGWHEREVDLSSYQGQSLSLSLATTPGPTGDVTGDWAGWAEPRLEDPRASAARQIVKGKPWRAKWYEMGIEPADWIRAGEAARGSKQYEIALAWYGWAERLSAGKGDAWYYRGILYEDRKRWTEALDAYERAMEASLLEVPESSLHYRAGVIYLRRLEAPRLETAIDAFEAAIAADDFADNVEAADCHYRLGDALREQRGYSPETAALFREATVIDPAHAWAHLQLGLALYRIRDDADPALESLHRALEQSPGDKWIHFYLAEIYRQEERYGEARQGYLQALAIDAEFDRARRQMEDLPDDE